MSNDGYGIEKPGAHSHAQHREPARYLVVIDTDGSASARLFLASRGQAAEFDAGSEEVAQMTRGLVAAGGADGNLFIWRGENAEVVRKIEPAGDQKASAP